MSRIRRVTFTFDITSDSSEKDIDELPGEIAEVIANAFAERGLPIVDVVVAVHGDERFDVKGRNVPTDPRVMVTDPNIIR